MIDLSCQTYSVKLNVDESDLDAVLGTPVFIALLAALGNARARRAVVDKAEAYLDAAVVHKEAERAACLHNSAEGAALQAAQAAADAAYRVRQEAIRAKQDAEAKEAVDCLLGRQPAFSADGARAAFQAAMSACDEADKAYYEASRLMITRCAASRIELSQANEALTLARAEARQADDELRKAAEPLRLIVSLHANHW